MRQTIIEKSQETAWKLSRNMNHDMLVTQTWKIFQACISIKTLQKCCSWMSLITSGWTYIKKISLWQPVYVYSCLLTHFTNSDFHLRNTLCDRTTLKLWDCICICIFKLTYTNNHCMEYWNGKQTSFRETLTMMFNKDLWGRSWSMNMFFCVQTKQVM